MTKIDKLCPEAAVLGAYIDGALAADSVPDVTGHVSRCAECRRAVANIVEIEDEEESLAGPQPFKAVKWVALAAVLVLIVAIPFFRAGRDENNAAAAMKELTAASPTTFRFIEPRLSGGFPWAPYRGIRRGTATPKTTEELIASGAAGKVVRKLSGERQQESLHVTGVAYLVAGDTRSAVKFLSEAAAHGNHATTWSDLSAALYIAAGDGRAASFQSALDAADRAIRIDPSLAEAHFNRAIILQQIGTPSDVADAWRSYVSKFPDGRWSTEAAERLADLRRE